ncbi:hypothetical protein QT592_22505, partial [Xanthomonas citri pv. citri]
GDLGQPEVGVGQPPCEISGLVQYLGEGPLPGQAGIHQIQRDGTGVEREPDAEPVDQIPGDLLR